MGLFTVQGLRCSFGCADPETALIPLAKGDPVPEHVTGAMRLVWEAGKLTCVGDPPSLTAGVSDNKELPELKCGTTSCALSAVSDLTVF